MRFRPVLNELQAAQKNIHHNGFAGLGFGSTLPPALPPSAASTSQGTTDTSIALRI